MPTTESNETTKNVTTLFLSDLLREETRISETALVVLKTQSWISAWNRNIIPHNVVFQASHVSELAFKFYLAQTFVCQYAQHCLRLWYVLLQQRPQPWAFLSVTDLLQILKTRLLATADVIVECRSLIRTSPLLMVVWILAIWTTASNQEPFKSGRELYLNDSFVRTMYLVWELVIWYDVPELDSVVCDSLTSMFSHFMSPFASFCTWGISSKHRMHVFQVAKYDLKP